nr:uncharacterized protein LOC107408288 isoform X2 [Ziziphus jujuba var. spinosa]
MELLVQGSRRTVACIPSTGSSYHFCPAVECVICFHLAKLEKVAKLGRQEPRNSFGAGHYEKFQLSSLHNTFPFENEWHKLSEQGFLQRIGMQYHWRNCDYKSFDEFLMDIKQSKRKNIRQERKKILQQNLTMKCLRGYEIKCTWPSVKGVMHGKMEVCTVIRPPASASQERRCSPYLTRDFFHIMGSKMGDQVPFLVAEGRG